MGVGWDMSANSPVSSSDRGIAGVGKKVKRMVT